MLQVIRIDSGHDQAQCCSSIPVWEANRPTTNRAAYLVMPASIIDSTAPIMTIWASSTGNRTVIRPFVQRALMFGRLERRSSRARKLSPPSTKNEIPGDSVRSPAAKARNTLSPHAGRLTSAGKGSVRDPETGEADHAERSSSASCLGPCGYHASPFTVSEGAG